MNKKFVSCVLPWDATTVITLMLSIKFIRDAAVFSDTDAHAYHSICEYGSVSYALLCPHKKHQNMNDIRIFGKRVLGYIFRPQKFAVLLKKYLK